ncbi:MAG: sigma factor-like helix-turn-helix DNA-binding protein [Actinophytocola sp.]|uniref:sigma factor-like helix-turn-helix DNA-binding protein n=1 Tax=Actinophytocola sp. TaxID=1872138 RepID=UPI003D6AD2D9
MVTDRRADDLTELALAAGRGDRDAMERFVRATQRDVWRLVAHLADVSLADDLTRETYLRALPAPPGLPYAEAAAICHVPVGTIRSRVARAREDLLGADQTRREGAG